MRRYRILAIAAIAGLVSIVAPSRAQAGVLRIALLSSAEVHSDTILLADLLSARAPQFIRDAAQDVSLGAAPQFGSTRLLSSETVRAALSDAGLSPSQFVIPEVLAVRRGDCLVSANEVFTAIQSAQAHNSALALLPAELPVLTQIPTVPIPCGSAGLQVTQTSIDPLLGEIRFRLVAKSAPGLLPLYVTAKPSTSSSPSAAPRLATAQNLAIASPAFHSPAANRDSVPSLVTTNHPARLHLHSADMDMILEVRPLQKGQLNEIIRVRLLSGAILKAQVTGSNYLDAAL
jgi:hypothetical protein